jgi:transcriptional regulator GlxA family with amidase domain
MWIRGHPRHNSPSTRANAAVERAARWAPIEAIANEVGYEGAGFFSRLFRRQVMLTPAQYRRRFGGMRRALAGRE